jgi:hypothetical protein
VPAVCDAISIDVLLHYAGTLHLYEHSATAAGVVAVVIVRCTLFDRQYQIPLCM